ncbi:hypothetical protein Ptr902_06667 [Pyrenophora tritici-repentis]|nr:hypothetical protein Ptr902_06667 [Pyrenophora tritici-repentis]
MKAIAYLVFLAAASNVTIAAPSPRDEGTSLNERSNLFARGFDYGEKTGGKQCAHHKCDYCTCEEKFDGKYPLFQRDCADYCPNP